MGVLLLAVLWRYMAYYDRDGMGTVVSINHALVKLGIMVLVWSRRDIRITWSVQP